VLVEGNVERLLLPLMIQQSAPELQSCHLTILEVGGAFAHKFRELVEFLGLPTLVITDIDSVCGPKTDDDAPATPDANGLDDADGRERRASCMTTTDDAVTSNETLATWIPGIRPIVDLLDLPDKDKCPPSGDNPGHVRVAYETRQAVEWNGERGDRAGRTFEEAFALQNLTWCQDPKQAELGLYVRKAATMSLDQLHETIHRRVKNLDKTNFALALITANPAEWIGPRYIVEGLEWLRDQLTVKASDTTRLTEIEAEVGG
jgi:predicted ATP-dependent endonuclease of OLD family